MLTIPAAGRSFALGLAYNGYNDSLIEGMSYYKISKPDTQTTRDTRSFLYETKSIMQCSRQDQAELLDISSELSLSVISGLVSVSGSTKYLTDHKASSANEYFSFYCYYKSMVTSIVDINDQTPSVDLLKTLALFKATHVVASLEYGACCILAFRHKRDQSVSNHKFDASFKADILKLFRAGSGVEISDAALKYEDTLEVSFYGEGMAFHKPCLTMTECIEFVANIGNYLPCGENVGVVLKANILPIANLVIPQYTFHSILDVSFDHLHSYMSQLDFAVQVCEDCERFTASAACLTPLAHLTENLKLQIKLHIEMMKNIIKIQFPLIRSGDNSAKQTLIKITDNLMARSPFIKTKLGLWLKEFRSTVSLLSTKLLEHDTVTHTDFSLGIELKPALLLRLRLPSSSSVLDVLQARNSLSLDKSNEPVTMVGIDVLSVGTALDEAKRISDCSYHLVFVVIEDCETAAPSSSFHYYNTARLVQSGIQLHWTPGSKQVQIQMSSSSVGAWTSLAPNISENACEYLVESDRLVHVINCTISFEVNTLYPRQLRLQSQVFNGSQGRYRIKNAHGQYFCASGDKFKLTAHLNEECVFDLIPCDDFAELCPKCEAHNGCVQDGTCAWLRKLTGLVAFRSCHGKYLSAQKNGTMECDRLVLRCWEKFTIRAVSSTGRALQTFHSHYVSTKMNGKLKKSTLAQSWETFEFEVVNECSDVASTVAP